MYIGDWMKKTLLLLLLIAVSFSIWGCLPAQKKIALPEYDRTEKYDRADSGGEKALQEEQLKKVPDILLESSSLEWDGKYQKNDGSELPTTPAVQEENILDSGGIPQRPKDSEVTSFSLKLPEQNYVSYRLKEYTKALREWNGMAEKMVAFDAGAEWPDQWHECVQGLEYMVSGYKRVQSLLQPVAGDYLVPPGFNPWDIVQRDVRYLESNCETVYKQSAAVFDELVSDYRTQNIQSLAALIQQLVVQGDYRGVISAYENSAAILNGETVSFAVHFSYVQALVRNNRVEEALQFVQEQLRREGLLETPVLEESKGVWQAKMQYADLLLIMGQVRKAKSIYLELDDLFAAMEKESEWVAGQLHLLNDYKQSSEGYAAFVRLLTEYMYYDGRGVPQSLRGQYEKILADYDDIGLQSSARRVMRKTEEQARQWAKAKIVEADYLAHGKDFINARKILEALVNLPDDMRTVVAKALKDLAGLEQEDMKSRRLLEREELAVQWEKAVALFEAEDYEKAIAAFSFLSDSEYGRKAEKKGKEVIDKHAAQLRIEAADLFVAAQNIKEPASKGNMMMRSRGILLYILTRYPEAEIVSKVEQNLQALEEQIRTYNPRLLGP